MGYTYFTTPDGQDCDKKLLYLTKKAGLIGIAWSTSHILLFETPKGYVQTISTFAKLAFPFVAVALAGGISVCLLTDLRKKDDQLNHFYGGFIGGLAGGLARGHFGHGLYYGFILGAISMVVKDGKMHNREFFTDTKTSVYDHWSKDYDWTVTAKRKPDWVSK